MGNCCSTKESKKNISNDNIRLNHENTIDNEIPKQLISGTIKKAQLFNDEEVIDTNRSKSFGVPNQSEKQVEIIKRNERKNFGKIKQGDDVKDDKIYENIVKIQGKQKSREDRQIIKDCFKKHFVFYNLTLSESNTIIDNMFYCESNKGEYIFKQGDNASSYLVICKGQVDIIINDKKKKTLGKGEGFGELALLYNAVRSGSAMAAEPCGFWVIDRATFRKAVEDLVQREYIENRRFIEGVSFFNPMTEEQRDAIAGVMLSEHYPKGEIIVNEGDQASSYYIIKEGLVSVTKGGIEIRKMNKGESFGEQALYQNTIRQCTVKAVEDTKVLSLGRDTLIQILGDQLQIVAFRNMEKWAYEKHKLLANLTKIQIEKLCDASKLVNQKAGDIVYAKGSLYSQKIVIVLEGSLKKDSSNTPVAKKGELWGDEYLLQENSKIICEDNIIMQTNGVLAEVPSKKFYQCIGGTLEAVIKKNENSHEKKMMNIISDLKAIGANLNLEDLIFYKRLGSGQFGSVYLVKAKVSNQFFALKCISKQQVADLNIHTHLLQEKAVLEGVNFPFIMQYIRSFKDNNFVYFLNEYIKGMELFDAIREINYLETSEAQLYIGQLTLALEYLHNKGIVYRDLKPENIMVDSQGYLKMIDMGTAKILKNKSGAITRTFTTIGTPHYMAPEILSGKGYTFSVDLWSLGILLYELMCGRVPFGEEADDPYEIYEEIATRPLAYPSFLKDKKAKRLMDQLINKVPGVRLGGSYAALKANQWFDTFDWDKLLDRQLQPPYVPPKDKIISDVEIRKMDSVQRKVIDEIENEIAKGILKRYKKDKSTNHDWDRNF